MMSYNSKRQLNRIQRQWRAFVGAALVAVLGCFPRVYGLPDLMAKG
jgi:hypothetical protein